MAAHVEFYRKRYAIADDYYALIKEVQLHQEHEYRAAQSIKKAWARHRERQALALRNRMALRIQKVVRRWLARILLEYLKCQRNRKANRMYFNIMASKLQSLWRGYQTRNKVLNWKKFKENLQGKSTDDAKNLLEAEKQNVYGKLEDRCESSPVVLVQVGIKEQWDDRILKEVKLLLKKLRDQNREMIAEGIPLEGRFGFLNPHV
jgi:hypothetical protein